MSAASQLVVQLAAELRPSLDRGWFVQAGLWPEHFPCPAARLCLPPIWTYSAPKASMHTPSRGLADRGGPGSRGGHCRCGRGCDGLWLSPSSCCASSAALRGAVCRELLSGGTRRERGEPGNTYVDADRAAAGDGLFGTNQRLAHGTCAPAGAELAGRRLFVRSNTEVVGSNPKSVLYEVVAIGPLHP